MLALLLTLVCGAEAWYLHKLSDALNYQRIAQSEALDQYRSDRYAIAALKRESATLALATDGSGVELVFPKSYPLHPVHGGDILFLRDQAFGCESRANVLAAAIPFTQGKFAKHAELLRELGHCFTGPDTTKAWTVYEVEPPFIRLGLVHDQAGLSEDSPVATNPAQQYWLPIALTVSH